MNFEVEISYKANLDIWHIYEYYVMNNFDLNYVRHLINGIVSLIKSLEYLSERYPRFELLKKETNVRYAIYKKYKTDPNDFSYATRNTNGKREISLTTCTDDSSARIIIWAKED